MSIGKLFQNADLPTLDPLLISLPNIRTGSRLFCLAVNDDPPEPPRLAAHTA